MTPTPPSPRPATASPVRRSPTPAARPPPTRWPCSPFLLSSLYESIGDLPAARAQLTQAVALQPENSESWLALGTYDLDHGHPAPALPSLRRAVALNPTVPVTTFTLNQALAAIKH